MVETFNSSKTAEILARYRPIAPKPLDNNEATENNNSNPINPTSSSGMHQKIRDSPYLRNIWPHMQARSTRTRRRSRTVLGPALPPSIYKRQSPNPTHAAFSPYHLSPNSLSSFNVFLPNSTTSPVEDLVINKQIPVEKDLLAQLQAHAQASRVVTPRPVRLVSSAISVQQQSTISNPGVLVQGRLKAVVEIEEEVESESLPIVVSDSNHKVRLVNSAYKKLVGQPECCWVPSVVREAVICNRICGEVMLQIPESAGEELVSSSNGFFCLVVIEWGNSEYKSSITTFGEAVRLFCESRDYMFAWRFHTQGASSPPNI